MNGRKGYFTGKEKMFLDQYFRSLSASGRAGIFYGRTKLEFTLVFL